MVIHGINPHGIPDECPGCGEKPIRLRVIDYDPMWHDGKVVCASCGHFIRYYDADI